MKRARPAEHVSTLSSHEAPWHSCKLRTENGPGTLSGPTILYPLSLRTGRKHRKIPPCAHKEPKPQDLAWPLWLTSTTDGARCRPYPPPDKLKGKGA